MEFPTVDQLKEKIQAARNAAATFIAQLDANPHEGRLRSSVAPTEFMNVPDHPPLHDDTIPSAE